MREIVARARGAVFTFWCNIFRKNISIGPNLKIYKKILVLGKGTLEIGSNCIIDGIKGDNSQFVCIDLAHPNAAIKIGNDVGLFAARLAAKFQISIGNGTRIEESAVIDTDYHSIEKSRENPGDERTENCKVSIGDGVYIGPRSVIMKGVAIGDGAVVVPGSVVVNSIKPGSVVCGNPARPY